MIRVNLHTLHISLDVGGQVADPARARVFGM